MRPHLVRASPNPNSSQTTTVACREVIQPKGTILARALQLGALRATLLDAGASEEKADKAAEELAG